MLTIGGYVSGSVGEIFRLGGNNFGVVLNLHRDKHFRLSIGGILLTSGYQVSTGDLVKHVSVSPSILVGDSLLSSLIDPLGNLVLRQSKLLGSSKWSIENPSPGILERTSVFEPVQTGLVSIDSLIPIGRGQRELIVGDRQTGKTSISLDSILNQSLESVMSIYSPVGQKSSAILEFFTILVKRDSISVSSLVIASSSMATS